MREAIEGSIVDSSTIAELAGGVVKDVATGAGDTAANTWLAAAATPAYYVSVIADTAVQGNQLIEKGSIMGHSIAEGYSDEGWTIYLIAMPTE